MTYRASHRWLVAATIGVALGMTAAPASAQSCNFAMGVYADGAVGVYDSNGNAALTAWGYGFDFSTCGFCHHGYQMDVIVEHVPTGVVMTSTSVPGDLYAETSANVSPGWYSITSRLHLWCTCFGGYVGAAAAGGQVEVPPPPQLQLSVTQSGNPVPKEVWNTTHYLPLKDTGDVLVTLIVTPPVDPSQVQWNFGGAGGLERTVSTSAPGWVTVTAHVGSVSDSVVLHVVDAIRRRFQGDPPDAPKGSQPLPLGLPINPADPGDVTIAVSAPQGVTFPDYDLEAYLTEAGEWVFHVTAITHRYRIGVQPSAWPRPDGNARVDVGDPPSFPVPPSQPHWTYLDLYDNVHLSLNPRHPLAPQSQWRVPYGPIVEGPPMNWYWSRFVTLQHENFHVADFYDVQQQGWRSVMRIFELDVASSVVTVTFNCGITSTTTKQGVIAGMRPEWNNQIHIKHNEAFMDWRDDGRRRSEHTRIPIPVM